MTETQAHWYSFDSTQRELSNEYQHDRVWMVFKNICIVVQWRKVASALEGLIFRYATTHHPHLWLIDNLATGLSHIVLLVLVLNVY